MKKVMIGLFTVVSFVILSACGSDTLEGNYTATLSFLWVENDVTMHFKGDRVVFQDTEVIDDEEFDFEEMEPMSYEITDDELVINAGGYDLFAYLSDDRESFTVTSADGDTFKILSGTTFTKEVE